MVGGENTIVYKFLDMRLYNGATYRSKNGLLGMVRIKFGQKM